LRTLTPAHEQYRQPRPNGRGSPRANAGNCIEATVMRRNFERLERIDVQGIVNRCRELRSNPGHYLEQRLGLRFATQAVELRETPGPCDLIDSRRQTLADRGQPDQALDAVFAQNVAYVDL
jgi:hypothetical protein